MHLRREYGGRYNMRKTEIFHAGEKAKRYRF